MDPEDWYHQTLTSIPFLTSEQIDALATQMQTAADQHAEDVRQARDQLIRSHLPFVRSIALQYRHNGMLLLDDLIGWGNVGLVLAVDAYALEYNTTLRAIAEKYIRTQIRSAIRYEYHRRRTRAFSDVSAHEPHWPLGSPLEADRRSCSSSALAEDDDLIARACGLIRKLPPREAVVLRLHFGLDGHEPHTIKAIAELLGKKPQWISVLKMRALQRLKRMLSDEQD